MSGFATGRARANKVSRLDLALLLCGSVTILLSLLGCDVAARAQSVAMAPHAAPGLDQKKGFVAARQAAIEQSLRHIYAVYLGIRSCSELSRAQNDRSYLPEVSLGEARDSLRVIDAAAREVGMSSGRIWAEEAPTALVTAEALKTHPETHLKFCQKMGSLFRVDAGNLQALLSQLGAKGQIILKDY